MERVMIRKNLYLFLTLFFCFSAVLLLFKIKSINLLPDKYFADSFLILKIMETHNYSYGKSYNFAAQFYNFFNFMCAYDWILWAFIINVVFLPIISIFIVKNIQNFNIFMVGWLFASLLLIEIYILHVSKDLINLLFTFAYLFLLMKYQGRKLFIVLGLLSLSLFYLFRDYYLLMFLAFCLFILMQKTRTITKILIVAGTISVILFAIPSDLFYSIFDVRNQLNAYREIEDAQSMIVDWIYSGGNKFLILLNYFISIGRLMLPIEILIIKFSPQYFVFFLYMVFMTYILFRNFRTAKKQKDRKLLYLTLWSFSIIFVHALFEPDYGSYARHFISYFAIWYMNMIYFFKNKQFHKMTLLLKAR